MNVSLFEGEGWLEMRIVRTHNDTAGGRAELYHHGNSCASALNSPPDR